VLGRVWQPNLCRGSHHQAGHCCREQIVAFVVQNTGGAVSLPAIQTNFDPFTGGGSYVAGAPAAAQGHAPTPSLLPVTGGDSRPGVADAWPPQLACASMWVLRPCAARKCTRAGV
jgi:hypothetical protein